MEMAKKPSSTTTAQKKEANNKAKWSSMGENNLKYIVNEKGFLIMSVNLNKVFKPSKSFYETNPKKNHNNILISSTGGNKALLENEFPDLKVSVNIYRPMTEAEIEEWKKKS